MDIFSLSLSLIPLCGTLCLHYMAGHRKLNWSCLYNGKSASNYKDNNISMTTNILVIIYMYSTRVLKFVWVGRSYGMFRAILWRYRTMIVWYPSILIGWAMILHTVIGWIQCVRYSTVTVTACRSFPTHTKMTLNDLVNNGLFIPQLLILL